MDIPWEHSSKKMFIFSKCVCMCVIERILILRQEFPGLDSEEMVRNQCAWGDVGISWTKTPRS